jgi:diguanylate cyclase (GGDEF)-like protein
MMLDIDKFKRVNDDYGHAAGDAVLVEMTRRIGSELRQYDQFARLGGEEFAIALPNTEPTHAQLIAERIRDVVSRDSYHVLNQKIAMTISIGVTQMLDGELHIDGALRRADAALYAAKQGGRDRVEVFAQLRP